MPKNKIKSKKKESYIKLMEILHTYFINQGCVLIHARSSNSPNKTVGMNKNNASNNQHKTFTIFNNT